MIVDQEIKVICWGILVLLSGIQATAETSGLALMFVGVFGLGSARAAYVLRKMHKRVRKELMISG